MRCMPYISRDTFYKSKYGSVSAGEAFTLKLLLPLDGYVQGAVVIFDRDGTGEQRFELKPDGFVTENGFYTRSCTVMLEEGLYFYRFLMYTVEGERWLLNAGYGVGDFDPPGGTAFQLTVYEPEFSTPDWVKGGVIYQIFPDRFCKGVNNCPIPEDRYLQNCWGAQPEYRQPVPPQKQTLGNDYFGGNLNGIMQKLPYLASLGVTIIYLNPIFEAHSNHRYNTADYFKIDPMLGTEQDFTALCKTAKQHGISVVLDGVFSHTGADSLYFNKYNRYKTVGAYNSPTSPYFSWYKFKNYPKEYASWWGIRSLPELDENNPDYTEFITGENGVLRYWLRRGASGFRLDVADELPDEFLDRVRAAIKAENPNAFLLGEVWEDASNKISYSVRRRFLRGRQLDSVMNYPFANAIISFLQGGSGLDFAEQVETVLENYPEPALHTLMNHIGTHDTARILTVLGGEPANGRGREWQAVQTLTNYDSAVNKLCAAALLQYTLVGVPSLYYGDEAGLSGYGDPFCRACFPWGKEDLNLTGYYQKLGRARQNCAAFKKGTLNFVQVEKRLVAFRRADQNSRAFVAVNRNDFAVEVDFSESLEKAKLIFGNLPNGNRIKVEPFGLCLFIL